MWDLGKEKVRIYGRYEERERKIRKWQAENGF